MSLGLSGNIDFEYEICLNNPELEGIFIDDKFNKYKMFLVRPFFHLLTLKFTRLHFSAQQSIKFWFLHFYIKKITWRRLFVNSETSLMKLLEDKDLRDKKLLVKIDIEGAEFTLLSQILKISSKITCLIIEFHNVDEKYEEIINFIINLNSLGMHLVSTTINECGKSDVQYLEMTFYQENMIGESRNIKSVHRHCYPKTKYQLIPDTEIRYFN